MKRSQEFKIENIPLMETSNYMETHPLEQPFLFHY